jgi:hypothetical protein
MSRFVWLMLLVLLSWPGAGAASDGVVEINQTCAVNTGCFSGDAAGYPITIDGTAGVSYRLTGSLAVPDENTDGIVVSAPSVAIDLNGFEIARAACVGATTICRATSGTGFGVRCSTFALPGISVKNGTITGMGNVGVKLCSHANVTNVRSRWNRTSGIEVGFGSAVKDSATLQNGVDGIYADFGSTITGNTVYSDLGDGIVVGPGALILGNTVYGSGDDGIDTDLGSGSLVGDNMIKLIVNGVGLRLSSDTVYRDNVITETPMGAVVGGVNAGGNACNGSLTCP